MPFKVEVTNVSPHGFQLLLDGSELFVSYAQFPWFAHASLRQITNVQRPSPHHLVWPALDIDLSVDSLHHPENFPLISRATKIP